jgi:ketosteroid isomerase-like protein
MRIALIAVSSLLFVGCSKPTPATADSTTPSATMAPSPPTAAFDESAARAQILGADSAFQRALMSKHVDSLMVYYDPDVVSMGANAKPIKGTTDLRASYDRAVKANNRNLSFQSGGVNFSNDHSMAWDHGTYSGTSDGPNGKPVTHSGSFMNVWKNVGGQWRIVAEIGT